MKITNLDGKVLDYWEKEFGGYYPVVNKIGEKFYSRRDVEIILRIKHMLTVEKRDKAQIRRLVAKDDRDTWNEDQLVQELSPAPAADYQKILKNVKTKLQEILTILEKNGTT